MADINWQLIQAEFENGLSLRALAAKYGVSKSTIDRRAKLGQWVGQSWDAGTIPPKQDIVDAPLEAVDLARKGLKDLSFIADGLPSIMPVNTHATFAQALTQYTKVIAAAPPAPDALNGPHMLIDPEAVKHMTSEERDTLQGLLKIGRERMQAEENAKLKRA